MRIPEHGLSSGELSVEHLVPDARQLSKRVHARMAGHNDVSVARYTMATVRLALPFATSEHHPGDLLEGHVHHHGVVLFSAADLDPVRDMSQSRHKLHQIR